MTLRRRAAATSLATEVAEVASVVVAGLRGGCLGVHEWEAPSVRTPYSYDTFSFFHTGARANSCDAGRLRHVNCTSNWNSNVNVKKMICEKNFSCMWTVHCNRHIITCHSWLVAMVEGFPCTKIH